MTANIYEKSGDMILDNDGEITPGAKLYFFDAETTTPRTTYSDTDLSSQRTHPVLADGFGRVPIIYMQYGAYDVKVTTASDEQLFYHVNLQNPSPPDPTPTIDETTVLNTGDIFFSLLNGTRTGAVRLNGRSIGNTGSTATERANADTLDLFALLWDNLADAQAAVSGGRGASAAADFAANKRITLPDFRGCAPVGFADMGGATTTRLDSAPVITGGAFTSGSVVGENTHVLATGELAAHNHAIGLVSTSSGAHTHSVSATAASDGAHTHALTGGSAASGGAHTHTVSGGTVGGTTFFPTGQGGGAQDFPTTHANIVVDSGGAHTHSLTGTADSGGAHTHTVSGSTDNAGAHTHVTTGNADLTGSSLAHNIVSRSGLVTWFIKL